MKNEKDGESAVSELTKRCFLLIINDEGKVVFDETKLYIETGVLRYDVPHELLA